MLCELGYHDNLEDEAWITGNAEPIAAAITLSVCEYFGLPFLTPTERIGGTVSLESGALNLRAYPTLDAEILRRIPNGEHITVWGSYNGWLTAEYDGLFGFVRSEFVRLDGVTPR